MTDTSCLTSTPMSYLVRVQDMLSAAFLPNYEVQVSQNAFTKEQDFKLLFLRTVSVTSG